MSKIGSISTQVQALLNFSVNGDCNIYLGDSNIEHMKRKHFQDYQKYGHQIKSILMNPDFVAFNSSDKSVEYVKEFKIDNEYVKVAVRVSNSGKYYARSLYVLNNNRVENFIKRGDLTPI